MRKYTLCFVEQDILIVVARGEVADDKPLDRCVVRQSCGLTGCGVKGFASALFCVVGKGGFVKKEVDSAQVLG